MQSKDWLKIKEIFAETIELPETERPIFLANYEPAIRLEVEKLLKSYQKLNNFIEVPAIVEIGLDEQFFIDKIIGDYKIVEIIGEGGMGVVYLAERQGFEQKVALKLIKRGMDSRAILKRFFLERQILSRLNHPNIAKLLDGGTTNDGLPYLVMEYIEGLPLLEFCNYHRFSTNERLELFRKICEAVSYAHQNLVVHRDLKPSNIIITSDGTPKLLDFGIAKLLGEETENTSPQSRIFTPEYASPEQLKGLPITTSADVYSLGVILYELLSGVCPFQTNSKNYAEIADLVLTLEPQKPSVVVSGAECWSVVRNTDQNNGLTKNKTTNLKSKIQNPKSLKGDLDNIILKSIRKEPNSRYASVQEFSGDILRFLKGLPVTATADSTRYRFSKFVQRHRQGMTITAFVLLLIFGLSGFSIYQSIIANRERATTERSFAELRKRANELMNETNESLAKINGSVIIRKNLVGKSVAMLDSIAAEKPDDIEVLQDLAAGYESLGRKQNFEFREFENSTVNLSKAVEIRRQILAKNPTQLEAKSKLINALSSLGETFFSFGKTSEFIQNLNEREKLLRELYEAEPENIERLNHLTTFYLTSAEINQNLDETERRKNLQIGLLLTEELIKHYQNKELTAKEMQDYAYTISGKAIILNDLGKTDESLAFHEKSSETAKKAFEMDESLNLAFNLTVRSQRYQADIFRANKQFDKALEMYQNSLNRLETALEKPQLDPHGQVRKSINIYQIRQALMLEKIGQKMQAANLMKSAYVNYLAKIEQNNDDSSHVLYFYEALPDVAEFYLASNQIEKAVEVWENHLQRVQYFLTKNPEDILFQNYLSDAYQRIGEIYVGVGRNREKAKTAYQKALENYEKTYSNYPPTQAEIKNLQALGEKINRL